MRLPVHPLRPHSLPIYLGLVAILAIAPAQTAEPAAGPQCGPIEGVDELPAEPLLLFGEIHGTDLSPAVFSDVVCHLGRQHGEVVVGLEIARNEQARIDAFLSSGGTEEDRRGLLAGEFWTDPYQDGRRSRAMVAVIEDLRALRGAGIGVEVVAFDPLPEVEPSDREEGMARHLVQSRRSRPDAPFAVLAGNYHPRTVRGAPWDPEFLPMGSRIAAAGVAVLPIDIRHAGGSAWICTGSTAEDCGARSLGGSGEASSPPVFALFAEPEERPVMPAPCGWERSRLRRPQSRSPPGPLSQIDPLPLTEGCRKRAPVVEHYGDQVPRQRVRLARAAEHLSSSQSAVVWYHMTDRHDLSRPLPEDLVIEAYKRGVDRTLIRENLKLTQDQRVRKMLRILEQVQEIRGAARRSRKDG